MAFNSTSLILVVYWIKTGTTIQFIPPCIFRVSNYASYISYILLIVLLTYLSLFVSKFLDNDNIDHKGISSIESANNSFLPSYLGYFFVALDVPNSETLYFVYGLIFAFTFLSQTLYFNPLFLLFGYHFYYLTTVNHVRIFMITRKQLKIPQEATFPQLLRINDYTFIDKEN
jgi:hypothetical protein